MKLFQITGEMEKKGLKTPFVREIMAAKPEHAVERVYAELGSKHRVRRFHIRISNVKEMPLEQVKSPSLKKLIEEEKVGE